MGRIALRPGAQAGRSFALKAAIEDPGAETIAFPAVKTMYDGLSIAAGDTVYLFASETSGGGGLVARGVVTAAEPVPRSPGVARQTPRVSVTVSVAARASRPLGRAELKRFARWNDGRPETELNFKLYRQATDKIVRLSDAAAACLERLAGAPHRPVEHRGPRRR